ncbi:MAG: tetratricopeptide repeat protein, partial [Ktedonobacteraceae bacterium]|nr:tetratricopeptide repeat protein [Ktedonobacteraceae bacterium]
LNDLALLYQAQGRYEEAEPLYERALQIYEKTMRPDHPGLATILGNYAYLLEEMQRPDEAAQLRARAQAIRAKRQS